MNPTTRRLIVLSQGVSPLAKQGIPRVHARTALRHLQTNPVRPPSPKVRPTKNLGPQGQRRVLRAALPHPPPGSSIGTATKGLRGQTYKLHDYRSPSRFGRRVKGTRNPGLRLNLQIGSHANVSAVLAARVHNLLRNHFDRREFRARLLNRDAQKDRAHIASIMVALEAALDDANKKTRSR